MGVVVAFGLIAFLIVVFSILSAESARKASERRIASQDEFIHVRGRRYVVVDVTDENRDLDPMPVDDQTNTVQGSSRVYNVEPPQIGSGQKRIEGTR